MIGLPWYAHKLHDYDERTEHLTMLQHGAYRLMMDAYYRRGGPLPAKLEQLHRICKALAPDEQAAISVILSEFFVLGNDGWHNVGCDKEIKKAKDLSDKRRKAAKSGKNGEAKAETIAPAIADTATPAKDDQLPTRFTFNEERKEETLSLRSSVSPPAQKRRPPSSKLKTTLPDDSPDPMDRDKACKYWRGHGREDLCSGIEDEVLAFRAHHLKNGQTSADWSQSWVTWYVNAPKFNGVRHGTGTANGHAKPSARGNFIEGAAQFIAGLEAEEPDDTLDPFGPSLSAPRHA